MLKISLIDSTKERPLIAEGKLIAPWASEPRNAPSCACFCHGELLAEMIPERWMIDRNAHLIGAAKKETFSELAVLTPTKGQHISERFSLLIGEATDTRRDFKIALLPKFGSSDA